MEDHLSKDFEEWRPWLQQMRPDLTMVSYHLHCTLYYDLASKDELYYEIWADLMEGKVLNAETKIFNYRTSGDSSKN